VELPDFEEMATSVDRITKLSERKGVLEIQIKEQESSIFKRALVEEKYFQNGKPASATFVENAYKYTGFEGEILPLRYELLAVSTQLENAKSTFDLMKSKIEVWRSEQANSRGAVLY
jgi:hypothetical protein